MTVRDAPAEFQIPPGKNGKLRLKLDYGSVLSNVYALSPDDIVPPCSTFELLTAELRDPTGAPFAVRSGVGVLSYAQWAARPTAPIAR